MKARIHAAAGITAMSVIACFWVSTLVAELLLDHPAIAAVKQGIAYGLLILVPCMAATGGSGADLAKGRQGAMLDRKKKRMAIIAGNGLFLMIPMALFLNHKAGHGEFDLGLYSVQVFELVIGAVQLSLMGANLRDGLRLAGRSAPAPERQPAT